MSTVADVFDSFVYGGRMNSNNIDYIERSSSRLSSRLTESARRFYDRVEDAVYKRYDHSEAVRLARAAARRVANMWRPNGVYYIEDIGGIQNANADMQRAIMADPVVRRRYHRQEIDGFSETYVDLEPGKIGEDQYDYRRITNGIFLDDDNGNLDATTYYEDHREGDTEYDELEQIDIIRQWERVRALIAKGKEDPTSRWNSSL